MKCSKHPEVDAAAVCASCGRPICPECISIIEDKVSCERCTGLLSVVRSGVKSSEPAVGRSGLSTAAGVLGIVLGFVLLLGAVLVGFRNVLGLGEREQIGTAEIVAFVVMFVVGMVLAALGYYGLRKNK